MARALATEHRNNAALVHRVFVSLNNSYSSDADDIAVAYVAIARRDSVVAQAIGSNRILRDYLVKMMSEGWTSSEEQTAIAYLRGL